MLESENRSNNGERDNRGRFIRGNRGGGRRPIPQNVVEALKELVPTAIEKLSNIINNSDDEKLILDASKVIFDRVYGKPSQYQQIENISNIEEYKKLSDDELQKEIDKEIQKLVDERLADELSKKRRKTS
jgi:hypothetical protein